VEGVDGVDGVTHSLHPEQKRCAAPSMSTTHFRTQPQSTPMPPLSALSPPVPPAPAGAALEGAPPPPPLAPEGDGAPGVRWFPVGLSRACPVARVPHRSHR
jgi:hypothetical protein